MKSGWWSCVVVCGVLMPNTSHADEVPCADLTGDEQRIYNESITLAVESASAGDYTLAIDTMMEAYGLCKEDPKFELRIAQWFAAAGECEKARFWYDSTLALKRDGRFDDLIIDAQKEAQLDLHRFDSVCVSGSGERRGTVVNVSCGEEQGTLVQLDDRPPKACPASFTEVGVGRHVIVATRTDEEPYTSTIFVKEDQRSMTADIPAFNAPERTSKSSSRGLDSPDAPSYTLTIVGSVVAGLGLAGLITAAVFEAEGVDKIQEFNDLAIDVNSSDAAVRVNAIARREVLTEEISELSTIATTLWIAGGLLTAAGLTMIIYDLATQDNDNDTQSSSMGFWVQPNSAGVSWRIRW